jgi:hypothetical protein
MQAFAGFAGAGAVVYAAARGSNSFDSWLKQRIRERKIAVGERVLTAVYKAKDAFPSIRNAGHFGYELSAAQKKLEESYDNYHLESQGKQQRLKTAQVILDRIARYNEVWTELYECLPIARALFGIPLEEAIREILKQRNKLSVSAQVYPDADPQSDKNFYDRIQADVWDGWADALGRKDEIGTAVLAAVESADAIVLPTLSDTNLVKSNDLSFLRQLFGK